MIDSIRGELAEALHAATLGEGVACDYHQRPKEISTEESVLVEAMRLVDHPQLQIEQWPEDWVIDAVRCADHAVDEIVAPTRGFEEALISVSLTVSNGVVSVSMPSSDDVSVLDVSPATDGTRPILIDQQLVDARQPNDHGVFRWTRIAGMLAAEPPEPLRGHIENLIEGSQTVPETVEKRI
ncbi:hypothetical protein [Halocatena marina]|uniref:Uncharacterized protein n=1 Tax=Halocatena marina TaxID=2934937 RepID=A0ABD5YXP2_9EURY|nr:hypothetical protein [Halocatena marina]